LILQTLDIKTSYVRNWRRYGKRVTGEEAQKKLGDLVGDAVAGSEQAQQAMVDGIRPFSLPYQ